MIYELPDQKKQRFIEVYKLKNYDAEILVDDQFVANFFEDLVKNRDSKIVVSWLTGELFSYLKKRSSTLRFRYNIKKNWRVIRPHY